MLNMKGDRIFTDSGQKYWQIEKIYEKFVI